MPNQKINQPAATFVKGLITEASPLTFPENASLDEVNFRLKRDGSRDKRFGQSAVFEYFLPYPYTRLEAEKMYAKVYKWEQPKGAKREVIGVVQVGVFLYFLDLYSDDQPTLLNSNDPSGYAYIDTSSLLTGRTPIEFATINGYLLLLCSEIPNPWIAWYSDAEDLVHWGTSDLLVRDLWGVDDGLGNEVRPVDLSELHRYNLYNQGWTSDIVTTCGTDVLTCVKNTFGVYPSNVDSWGVGRTADLTSADVYKFDPDLALRNLVNNQPAAKGKYIIHVYNRGLSRNEKTLVTLPTDSETNYCSTIEAFAGRAWYSGVRGKVQEGDDKSPNYNQAVFFSQVMETPLNLVKCYQEADPTSYDINEVVDTDGGVIFIPECSFVVKLKAMKASLWVFGDNGVWEIRGPEGSGFTATTFEVRKINSIGVSSKDSIVDANGTIFYWSYSGIYAIMPNPNMDGRYDTVNVTQTTIQSKYDTIDTFSKLTAKGIYDPYNNKIRWLFSDYSNAENFQSIGECNHSPGLMQLSSSSVFLITRKNSAEYDYAISYLYVLDLTNNQVTTIRTPYTLAYSDNYLDINGHAIVKGYVFNNNEYEFYYFHQKDDTTDELIVQKLKYYADTKEIDRVIANPVVLNTECKHHSSNIQVAPALFGTASVSFTHIIVAFHNNSGYASLQYVDKSLAYGAITSTANLAYYLHPLSIASLSSTTGVLCYRGSSSSSLYLDYFTRSGTSITINSSTLFYNATQVPVGTHTVSGATMIKISATKLLVCASITNATLGYTNVISCFIVTISGSVLTSTTLLDIPTEIGTNPKAVLRGTSTVTIIYENGTSWDTNKLRYINVDVSGTTPVLGTVGDWYSDVSTEWNTSHVHAELALDSNTIVSAFRGVGSLGWGSSAVYVSDIT